MRSAEVALRHQFEFKLPAAVQPSNTWLSAWRGKLQMTLAHAPGLEQRGQAGVAVARVVVDHGELARALFDQAVDQLTRDAGGAEAADQDGSAIAHTIQCLGHRG
jgi:hypothetical protein